MGIEQTAEAWQLRDLPARAAANPTCRRTPWPCAASRPVLREEATHYYKVLCSDERNPAQPDSRLQTASKLPLAVVQTDLT